MTRNILGGVIAVGLTFFCASSNAQAKEKKMNEALTINGDGAQSNRDIHWPNGQHPEDADLYAHNEIMVNASCETVFANIVDAQSWPSRNYMWPLGVEPAWLGPSRHSRRPSSVRPWHLCFLVNWALQREIALL